MHDSPSDERQRSVEKRRRSRATHTGLIKALEVPGSRMGLQELKLTIRRTSKGPTTRSRRFPSEQNWWLFSGVWVESADGMFGCLRVCSERRTRWP